MWANFDIGRYYASPGKRLSGCLIKLKPRVGAAAELASIPAKHGVKIVYLAFPPQLNKSAAALAFLDFTESDATPEELAEEARRLEFVEDVKIINPRFQGFIADTASSALTMGGSRAIVLSLEGLRGLLVNLRERMGSGAEAILYFSGFEVGREWCKKYSAMSERLGIRDVRGKAYLAADMFMSTGYGAVEILKFEEGHPYVLVRIHRCAECELGRGAGKPFSQFIRGALAGFASELLKQKMFAREDKCLARGDPYCEFEIVPEEAKGAAGE